MLLEFASALERALFNAFEGCCSCHPVADKTSSFFHTNRKVSATNYLDLLECFHLVELGLMHGNRVTSAQ